VPRSRAGTPLCRDKRRHARLKLDSLPNASGGIDAQAVDLHHSGVALQLDEVAPPIKGAREQPERRGSFHHDVCLRSRAKQGVNDFDRPRGVAETVP
jgi:hypothetical protein